MLCRPIGFIFRLVLKGGKKPIPACLDTNKFSRQFSPLSPKNGHLCPFFCYFRILGQAPKEMPGINLA